jgi:protocatechuate 3,4-dioxygenase alpha subunit
VADNQSPELFGQTPWQTVGPFFHYALPWKGGADLRGASALGARAELIAPGHDRLTTARPGPAPAGEPIEVAGRVLDGHGEPVPDALIEIWQANAAGRYASEADARDEAPLDPGFLGYGRAATDEAGGFRFLTIRPGCTPGPGNSLQAPHIAVSVLARGVLRRLVTRIYFDGAPENADDPVLSRVPAARRERLLARREGDAWRFDMVLQGPRETVFFAI